MIVPVTVMAMLEEIATSKATALVTVATKELTTLTAIANIKAISLGKVPVAAETMDMVTVMAIVTFTVAVLITVAATIVLKAMIIVIVILLVMIPVTVEAMVTAILTVAVTTTAISTGTPAISGIALQGMNIPARGKVQGTTAVEYKGVTTAIPTLGRQKN